MALLNISITSCSSSSRTSRPPCRSKAVAVGRRPRAAATVCAASAQHVQAAPAADAMVSLGPYLIYANQLQLQAVWDARAAHDSAALADALDGISAQGGGAGGGGSVVIDRPVGSRNQALVRVTVVCSPEAREQVAATLIQHTPATHVSITAIQHCFLPHHTVPAVSTPAPGHAVDMHLAMAGSTVVRATPDWAQCDAAAAAAAARAGGQAAGAAGGSDAAGSGQQAAAAATVAAGALQALEEGLADGSIQLGVQHWH